TSATASVGAWEPPCSRGRSAASCGGRRHHLIGERVGGGIATPGPKSEPMMALVGTVAGTVVRADCNARSDRRQDRIQQGCYKSAGVIYKISRRGRRDPSLRGERSWTLPSKTRVAASQ